MRVAIAGSRAVPKGMAPRLLVRFLANLPEDAVICLRRGRVSPPGEFERQTAMVCDLLGLEVDWMAPAAPTEGRYEQVMGQPVLVDRPVATWDADPRATAREATFARDMEFVSKAELVLTFTTVDQIGQELSGTAALVDKALLEEIVVYSYAIDVDGTVLRVGEHDPKSLFAELVPEPS